MASTSESVEYKTLVRCTSKLTTAFKSSPISIANELFSKEFIPPELHDKVTGMTSVLGDDMKATSLVKCVTDQVSMCPGKYYDFMALLKEPWLSSLHDAITTEYESLKKDECKQVFSSTADKNEKPSSNKSADERTEAEDKVADGCGDAYDVFRCPCGKCSLESYLEGGCPKSNSDSFPYLNIGMLDKAEKEDLTAQLFDDTSEMITSFAKLLDEICVSLERQKVSVERLAMRAITLGAYESEKIQKPLLSEDEKELRSSKTIDGAFFVLRPHMSFFNFELLKHITECRELCSDSDRQRMDEYIRKFGEFCKRKVFEVPPGAVGQPTSELRKRRRKAFVVLMTKHEAEPNLVYVNAAKRKIAKLLKLKPSTLHLHRIDEGSLIFVFSVPNFVARKLFPLKPLVVAKLKDEGFLISTPPAVVDKGSVIMHVVHFNHTTSSKLHKCHSYSGYS